MEIPEIYCEKFHESANRPDLISGCEGNVLGLVFVLTVLLIFCVPHWWGILGSIVTFLICRGYLREKAKEDPKYFAIHLDAQRYKQGFWTAKRQQKRTWRTE